MAGAGIPRVGGGARILQSPLDMKTIALLAVMLCAASACIGLEPVQIAHAPLGTTATDELTYSSMTTFGANVEPVAWDKVTHRIVYNRRGTDNLWDAYWSNPDGTDERCITCTQPNLPGAGTATNRGGSDITPDGKYLLVSVEKGSHPGKIGDPITDPGRGVYNDLWLVSTDGSAAYPLTNLPTSPDVGTIWQRFDPAGGSIVWSQMYKGSDLGHLLGQWKLQLADLQWTAGTPSLTSLRSFEPESGRFYEPYGFGPDNDTIIFASDMTLASPFESKIWTTNRAFSKVQRIAPIDATGWFADYDEFAYFVPGTDRILFGRTYQSTSAGLDWWTMAYDGSDVRRVTYFNEPWTAEGRGYSLLGGLAFDPQNPLHIFVGRTLDGVTSNHYEGLMVNLEEYGPQNGLTAEYFAGTSLQQRVRTQTDPDVELQWKNTPPAPGAPSTNDSMRWTGTLTPPQSGAYRLCLDTDDGGRVEVNGATVIDAWWLGVGVHCANVNLVANQAMPLQVEAWNGGGTGRAYLSWTRPDGVRETVGPTVLHPAS